MRNEIINKLKDEIQEAKSKFSNELRTVEQEKGEEDNMFMQQHQKKARLGWLTN